MDRDKLGGSSFAKLLEVSTHDRSLRKLFERSTVRFHRS